MNSVVWREAAEADVVEHCGYLGRENQAIADRFLDRVWDTIELLRTAPMIGHRLASRDVRLREVRYKYVRSFPNHAVFYAVQGSRIEIVAVLHMAGRISRELRRR